MMITQFLIILSSILLTVGPNAFAILKSRTSGQIAIEHFFAIGASANGNSNCLQSGVKTSRHDVCNEILSTSLTCSTNLHAIAAEKWKVPVELQTLRMQTMCGGSNETSIIKSNILPMSDTIVKNIEEENFGGVYVG